MAASTAATPWSSACWSPLASTGRSSVMLVGPSDVGKTALLHEVAARLASGNVPSALGGRLIWRITANELIAGAAYTGMWQERARLVVMRGRKDGTIFAMGDPVGIIDAGRWSKSDNNLSRFLRPVRRARRAEPDLRVHA